MSDTNKLLDIKDEVAEKVRELGRTGAAEYYGINPSTFRDFLYKNDLPTKKDKIGPESKGLKIKGDDAEITTDEFVDPDEIIKERKLDPSVWQFEGLTDSEWQAPSGEWLKARKLNLRYKATKDRIVLPARIDIKDWVPPKGAKKKDDGSVLFAVLGDQQAPFHDPVLEDKQLQLIDSQKDYIQGIVNLGDTNDFPTISRFKGNPELELVAAVQDCMDSGAQRLWNQRTAAPDAEIIKIIGNHDVRWRNFQIERIPEAYGIRKAKFDHEDIEGEPLLNLKNVMRLDELKVDLVGEFQSWEHGQYNISDYLAVRHGWYANKGSGKSALSTLEHAGYSMIVGHTHRQAIVHKTTFDIHGNSTTICGVEIGGSCRLDVTGLGFAPLPDWQQGGCTVQVWPDGRFHVDLMTYVNEELYWRDMRF